MLESLSLSELKARAAELEVVPTGDRRCKQVWIDAIRQIESIQMSESYSDIAAPLRAAGDRLRAACERAMLQGAAPLRSAIATTEFEVEPGEVQTAQIVSGKKGASVVIASLLCFLFAALLASIGSICAALRLAIVLIRTVPGHYLDPWHFVRRQFAYLA